MPDTTTATVRHANDRFRRGDPDIPCQWVMTEGVSSIVESTGAALLDVVAIVQAFDTFIEDNDPSALMSSARSSSHARPVFGKSISTTTIWSSARQTRLICPRRPAS